MTTKFIKGGQETQSKYTKSVGVRSSCALGRFQISYGEMKRYHHMLKKGGRLGISPNGFNNHFKISLGTLDLRIVQGTQLNKLSKLVPTDL